MNLDLAFNGLACLALSAGVFASLKILGDQLAMKKWPVVQGIVNAANLTLRSGGYFLSIRVTYSVGGTTYDGGELAPTQRIISRACAVEKLKAFPVGSSVPLYYDPEDPATAYCEQSPLWQAIVMLLAFGSILFFCVMQLLASV